MWPQRGGRTRRPRTAGLAPSSAATSASRRRAPSARRRPSFEASSSCSAARWRRPGLDRRPRPRPVSETWRTRPSAGAGHALHVAAALEVGDGLGGGLLGDAEPLRQRADRASAPARGAGTRRRRRSADRPSRRPRSAAGPRPPSPSRRTAAASGRSASAGSKSLIEGIQPGLWICYSVQPWLWKTSSSASPIASSGAASPPSTAAAVPRSRDPAPVLGAHRRRAPRLGRHPPLAAEGRTPRAHAVPVVHLLGRHPRRRDRRLPRRAGRRTATSTRACGSCTPRRPSRSATTSTRSGPEARRAEGAAMLRLDPWRLHVADAMTAATPRVWRADTAYR